MLKKLFLILFVAFAFCKISFAEKKNSDAIVDADKVFYDKKLKKLIAQGNVEVYKDGFIIKANSLELDKINDSLRALGNVKITEPNGEEFYGSEAEIINNLKIFIIHELLTKIDKKISIGAAKAKYSVKDKELNMSKASVTTCKLCPGKKPQWQFNSSSVKYDENTDMIYHRNSFFEIYGVPVFYSPFLSHLSPKAKPKSGFLYPGYKYNNYYGNAVNLSYYYRANNSTDLTFSPIITKKQGVLYQANYRQLFSKSSLNVDLSYNEPQNQPKSQISDFVKIPSKRYLYDIKFSHSVNDNISINSRLNRVSDKSFLRNYYNKNENYLTSNVETKYQDASTYGVLKALHFQGLRNEDESGQTPGLFPALDVQHQSYYHGNIVSFDGNFIRLNRPSGVGVTRLIINGSAERTDYILENLEWQNIVSLRGDLYNYNHTNRYSAAEYGDIDLKKRSSRNVPVYQTNFSYPLVSVHGSYITILQPIVQFIVSPNFSQETHIINEDSLNIEITDSNLFSSNRYSGYDRFENGARLNYGVVGITRGQSKQFYYMIGQAYRPKKRDLLSNNSGWENKSSNIVGHIGTSLDNNISLFYKYRLTPNMRVIDRSELELQTTFNKLSLGARHIKYKNNNPNDPSAIVESIALGPTYRINREWFIEANMERNATKEKSFIVSSGAGLVYDGDCLWSKISAKKDYTRDNLKNVKPSFTVSFDFILKGLQ